MRLAGRARALPLGLLLASTLGLPLAADCASPEDGARAAVYDRLLRSGYSVNRAAPRLYCLAVRQHVEGKEETIDPPPAAMPRDTYDAPVKPASECRESGLVLYTSTVRWEGGTREVVGGLLTLYSLHPNVRRPKPERFVFRVEEDPVVGWLVTGPAPLEPAVPHHYWKLVEQYALGDRAAALRGLGRLSDRQVELAMRVAARRPAHQAALLHTEMAFSGPLGSLSARQARHLEFARRLAETRAHMRDGCAFTGRWFQAVVLRAQETADGGLGRKLAAAGLRSCPGDTGLLLGWGRLEETIAWHGPVWRPAAHTRADVALAESSAWGLRLSPQEHRVQVLGALGEARRLFETLAAGHPETVEAHLRLGHVLWRLGKDDAAADELRQALARASEAKAAYLARLFLGGIAEGRKQFPQAIEHYREAVSAVPQAQVARLALGQALQRHGLPEEAREVLRAALALPPHPDPYRVYPLAGAPSAAERLEALRREGDH